MKRTLAVALFTLVAACTTSGGTVTQQPTFNEGAAIVLTTITAVRTTSTALMNAKKISADDGENVLKIADAARSGVDVARKIATTDLKTAQGKLDAVKTVIMAQQLYLSTKEK